MTWKDRLVLGVLVVALGVVGAGILVPVQTPAPPAVRTPTTEPAYREGVLGRPASINPLTVRTQVDRDLVALIFRGLVRLGPNGSILPDLADHWTQSADGKTYRFYLRDDAYWHDGVKVTARDVVFTVGLLQDAAYDGPLGDSWKGIKVSREAEYVVRFDLPLAKGGFLSAATLPLLPEHALAGTPAIALADSQFSQWPLGNGPFRLVELDTVHAKLERVRSVEPAIDPFAMPSASPSVPRMPTQYDTPSEIELRFFENPAAMLAELQAGRLDAAGGLIGSNLQVALKTPQTRVVRYIRPTLTAVILNQLAPKTTFHSADVRAGLLAAIDRNRLVAEVLGGFGTRADSAIAPTSWAFDPAASPAIAYSPTAAAAGLTKGGWQKSDTGWLPAKDAKPLTIRLVAPDASTNRVANATAVRVATDWRALGLGVELAELPSAEYVEAIKARAFDAAVVDVDLGLDPDLTPLLSSGQAATGGSNYSGYGSQALDKLLVTAATKVDPTERKAAMSAVQKFLSANTPILPLYFGEYAFVVSSAIENVSSREIADPSGRYWDVIDWRLAGDK